MTYGAILKRLRKEKGYTQHEVAEYISHFSEKPYSFKMVSHWENGVSSPPVVQFLLLCEFYGVKDIQGTFRGTNTELRSVAQLNALGKNRVVEYIMMLSVNPLFSESEIVFAEQPKKYIRLYNIPAAAGAGSYLDNESYEDFKVDSTVPRDVDFAVRVSGDSMEPRFIDGQVIFIKEQQTLNVGEIGVFGLNGDSFVKQLGQGEFLSLNPRYQPIRIHDFDSIRIFGKVVG